MDLVVGEVYKFNRIPAYDMLSAYAKLLITYEWDNIMDAPMDVRAWCDTDSMGAHFDQRGWVLVRYIDGDLHGAEVWMPKELFIQGVEN